ncbi:MAG: sugar phosphate isomerase/epimerase [Bacteroidales bacterium]|nr:sugar phosphate isomerase/epimerase [Bacteroidales bacterium]
MRRRSFIKASSMALVGAAGVTPAEAGAHTLSAYGITPSLNAYSFNRALLEEGMGLEELFHYAARAGFTAIDLTAYYIPGYPAVPDDQALYEIKRMAFRTGISFSGTGVRNDFTLRDPEALAGEIDLVKQWIVAASKLGAPNIRIFDGKAPSAGDPSSALHQQVVDAFRECSLFAARYGVNVAFQNHHDFLINTGEIIDILRRVDSEWFGLMLDTGSIAGPDPYLEIEKLIPYAVTWQVKETVRSGEGSEALDVRRLIRLLHKHQYHGFLPIETLGEGDPRVKVQALYQKVSAYL